MREIREVLRLRLAQELSQKAIGQSLQLSVDAVNTYLSGARMRVWVGRWRPNSTTHGSRPPPPDVATERRPLPDWAMVHR